MALFIIFNFEDFSDATVIRVAKNSFVYSMVKNLPARQKTQVQSLGWDDPLE